MKYWVIFVPMDRISPAMARGFRRLDDMNRWIEAKGTEIKVLDTTHSIKNQKVKYGQLC